MNLDHYVYPGTNILKNKLGIENSDQLATIERTLTSAAIVDLHKEGVTGKFDVEHLKSIHARIFGDIYDWAGEFRDIQIYKGGTEFVAPEEIQSKLDELLGSVKDANYFRGLPRDEVVNGLSDLMGSLNMIHPFREGNGRTQRMFLEQLALNAGYELSFMFVSENDMRNASMASGRGDNRLLRYLLSSNMSDTSHLDAFGFTDEQKTEEPVHDKPAKKGLFIKLKELVRGWSTDDNDDDKNHDDEYGS